MKLPRKKGSSDERRTMILEEFEPEFQPWKPPEIFTAYLKPVPRRIRELADELEELELKEGLRIEWEDFGVPSGCPVSKPQQIGFLWRRRPDRAKKFELVFIKSTEPKEYSKRASVPKGVVPAEAEPWQFTIERGTTWKVPHSITRSDSYPMARAVLGRQRDLPTYGHRPSSIWLLKRR